jgi:serine/threonine protein kinase
MPLTPGARLGPYEVLAAIGAGGMGEVYRARDSRLHRDVALKILPAEFSGDAGRRQRFEQEARAIGALNHPNIVTIYDIGRQDGVDFIVTELVDGEALRAVIQRGAASSRTVIDVAGQIADGLSAAHSAGITHRDLKPENVMINREGRVKILDFGLAKQVAPPVESGETIGDTRTNPGTLLGTVNYMSPEQARAQEVDARSDIFSLGVILYELLTGKRPFQGRTPNDTISAILRDDAPDLPDTVPVPLANAVRHCLEKDPRRRFQSAADLAFGLRALTGISSTVASSARIPEPSRTRQWPAAIAPAAIALGLAMLLAGFALARFLAPVPTANIFSHRYSPFTMEEDNPFNPVFSPDGKSVAYNAPVHGITQVFVRNWESGTAAVQLTHENGDSRYPFWSPDQSRIYYVSTDPAGRAVWSVAVAGGSPQKVLGGLSGYIGYDGAALSPDGQTLAVSKQEVRGGPWGVWLSSPPGATPAKYLPAVERPNRSDRVRLRFSPDGKHLLVVYTLADQPLEFWLLPWPAHSSESPRQVLKSVRFFSSNGTATWFPDSRRILLSLLHPTYTDSHLWIADPFHDTVHQLTGGAGVETDAVVSPDGKTILYTSTERQMDIVELPLDGSPPRNLLATRRVETAPAWSPVGDQFVYVTDRRGVNEIWLKSQKDGWSRPIVTPKDLPNSQGSEHGAEVLNSPAFSPDGSRIAYVVVAEKPSIWISPVAGGPAAQIRVDDAVCEGPTWSPDGSWIAFEYNKAGKPSLAKVQVGSQQPPVILQEGGNQFLPQWSPNGEWITMQLPEGFGIISPDGETKRVLSTRLHNNNEVVHGWSRDSSTIYIAVKDGTHTFLSSLDVRSGAEKRLADYGTEVAFAGIYTSSIRLSLSPDGKSLATSTRQYRGELWKLEGFDPPRSWWQQLWER